MFSQKTHILGNEAVLESICPLNIKSLLKDWNKIKVLFYFKAINNSFTWLTINLSIISTKNPFPCRSKVATIKLKK